MKPDLKSITAQISEKFENDLLFITIGGKEMNIDEILDFGKSFLSQSLEKAIREAFAATEVVREKESNAISEISEIFIRGFNAALQKVQDNINQFFGK